MCNIFTSLAHIFSCLDMGCLPSNCAEEPAFASIRVLMLALSKKKPKKTTEKQNNYNKIHNTNKQIPQPYFQSLSFFQN